MAIYGFDVETVSRLKGHSAASKAAYILRSNIRDPYTGKTHYYACKKDLMYSEVLIPDNAPQDFRNLDTLLAEIEMSEKRYDARVGRVFRLSLPNDPEFSDRERIELAREYIEKAFISKGICAIMAVHRGYNPEPSKCNPHVHVLITDRPVNSEGFCEKKIREWNSREYLIRLRREWADIQNRAFREKEMDITLSHESLEVQGIMREPTRPLGREAAALERKGIQTEPGNYNRAILKKQKEQELECQKALELCRSKGRSR